MRAPRTPRQLVAELLSLLNFKHLLYIPLPYLFDSCLVVVASLLQARTILQPFCYSSFILYSASPLAFHVRAA